jgi:hypothetical protein
VSDLSPEDIRLAKSEVFQAVNIAFGKNMKFTARIIVLLIALALNANARDIISSILGQRANYENTTIFYPDFAVRFINKIEHKAGKEPAYTEYRFLIFDRETLIEIGSFTFVMAGAYDYPDFTLRGKRYAVEMFTTMSTTEKHSVPLKKGELILWDSDTAKTSNPRLYDWIWETNRGKKTPNQALQTTTRTVTPAASHPSRHRVSCLI